MQEEGVPLCCLVNLWVGAVSFPPTGPASILKVFLLCLSRSADRGVRSRLPRDRVEAVPAELQETIGFSLHLSEVAGDQGFGSLLPQES